MCQRSAFPGTERGANAISEVHEGRWQTDRWGRPRAAGKAPPDTPALKPYWGKPAVRNFRGDHGNGGIIRSPIRAMVLPGKLTTLEQALPGSDSLAGFDGLPDHPRESVAASA